MCTKPIIGLTTFLLALLAFVLSLQSLAELFFWVPTGVIPDAQDSALATFPWGKIRSMTIAEKRQWKELGYVVLRGVINESAVDAMLEESKRMCSWQLAVSTICQVEEGRWQSDIFRDFVFYSPIGTIVNAFIGGALRVYQDGVIAVRHSWITPLFYSFARHVDHGGLPGKYGGLHSDTLGASVWLPLQDVDNETTGGTITLYPEFVHNGCHYHMGERNTNLGVHYSLNRTLIHNSCQKYESITGVTPSVRKGDMLVWWPSMMHHTQPVNWGVTRYAWYAKVVRSDSMSCVPKDCGWKGRPCCSGPIPESGSQIRTPCYPQIYPALLDQELEAHFGGPQPLLDRRGYRTSYEANKDLIADMNDTCKGQLRQPTEMELKLQAKSSKEDEITSSLGGSLTREYGCEEHYYSIQVGLEDGDCYQVVERPPQQLSPGFPVRWSKELNHVDWTTAIKWGADVWGVDEGDWIRIGPRRYLPKHIYGAARLRIKEYCSPTMYNLCDERQKRAIYTAFMMSYAELGQLVRSKDIKLVKLDKDLQEIQESLRERHRKAAEKRAQEFGNLTVLPFAKDGLIAWFKSQDAAEGSWYSQVGTYQARLIAGKTAVKKLRDTKDGQPILYLRGDNLTSFDFGGIVHDNFTLCTVTRYDGPNHGRILQGSRSNFLHGQWAGYIGVAFYDEWVTARVGFAKELAGDTKDSHDWVIMCGTNGARRVLVNGTNRAIVDPRFRGGQGLAVNMGYMVREDNEAEGDKTSDWAIMEVIAWNRTLSLEEMQAAYRYLHQKLEGLPYDADNESLAGEAALLRSNEEFVAEYLAIRDLEGKVEQRRRDEKARIKESGFVLQKQVFIERGKEKMQCGPSNPKACSPENKTKLDEMMTMELADVSELMSEGEERIEGQMAQDFVDMKEAHRAREDEMSEERDKAISEMSAFPFFASGLRCWYRSEDAGPNWEMAIQDWSWFKMIEGEVEMAEESGHGASVPVRMIKGNRSAKLSFGPCLTSNFSICSATRWADPEGEEPSGRILTGASRNFVHGHWNRFAGVAFHLHWVTESEPAETQHFRGWVVMCGTNGAPLQYFNGVNVATKHTGLGGDQDLNVNKGQMIDSETSNFAVMEVMTWSRHLDAAQLEEASNYLLNKLDGNTSSDSPKVKAVLKELKDLDRAHLQERRRMSLEEEKAQRQLDEERGVQSLVAKAWMYRKRLEEVCSTLRRDLCGEVANTTIDHFLGVPFKDLETHIGATYKNLSMLHWELQSRREKLQVDPRADVGNLTEGDQLREHQDELLNLMWMVRWRRLFLQRRGEDSAATEEEAAVATDGQGGPDAEAAEAPPGAGPGEEGAGEEEEEAGGGSSSGPAPTEAPEVPLEL